jgi:hypothetical protein
LQNVYFSILRLQSEERLGDGSSFGAGIYLSTGGVRVRNHLRRIQEARQLIDRVFAAAAKRQEV